MKQDIVRKYREFSDYLNSIDLSQLCSMYSRKELQELKDTLHKIDIRSLPYELRTKIDEMKHREFPQLLGVYRYPVINEIDFLSDQEKIDLDKHLGRFRVGDSISSLWLPVKNKGMGVRVIDWLVDNGVIDRFYVVLCPNCFRGSVTKLFSENDRNELSKAFVEYQKSTGGRDCLLKKFMDLNYGECVECEEEPDFMRAELLEFNTVYKMKINGDKSLDYV